MGDRRIRSSLDLDSVLLDLIGDFMKPLYNADFYVSRSLFQRCHKHSDANNMSNSQRIAQVLDDKNEMELLRSGSFFHPIEDLAHRDLFLWCVLTNRVETAKVFLGHMKTRICASLIASKIYKSYLKTVADNESKEVLISCANEFENYACEALKYCYNYDEDKACEIAIRRIPIYGAVTCLQV